MFKMSTRLTVNSTVGIAVIVQNDMTTTQIEHRLDGDNCPRFESQTLASLAKIWDVRILMNLVSYAMTGELLHYAVTTGDSDFLDGGANISYPRTSFGRADTGHQSFHCFFE